MSANPPLDLLPITSGGFELYTPPTPFPKKGQPLHFVMLDDFNNIFYDVDYESPELRNTIPWTELALHTITDPAIVFPPTQLSFSEKDHSLKITGFLVSIQSRDSNLFTATKIGAVYVQPFQQKYMNWGALESLKGAELPSEMRAGLLRHLYNRRPKVGGGTISYVTPRHVLDNMPRQWHRNAAALNWELDDRFVGAVRIGKEQKWELYA